MKHRRRRRRGKQVFLICCSSSKTDSEVERISIQEDDERPPFDINLAVILAGFAFEAYSTPPNQNYSLSLSFLLVRANTPHQLLGEHPSGTKPIEQRSSTATHALADQAKIGLTSQLLHYNSKEPSSSIQRILQIKIMEVENRRQSTTEDGLDSLNARTMERKPGWKAVLFIIGNETIERIATYGMTTNFMVYLLKVFHLSHVGAAKVIIIWSAVSNFIPIIGASLADAYLEKFKTIAMASFGTLVGMMILTLTAWVPQFHPPSCSSRHQACVPPNYYSVCHRNFGAVFAGYRHRWN
ncbi:uncharacterized protein LOC133285564 isoform X2 [Gastrolobium bilobum]|nr:uncharacterized protein LOC133285564 isoform X2 [Gastrolobium bilobum]